MKSLLKILPIILVFLACNRREPATDDNSSRDTKESLIKANQHIVKTENEQIDDYIARYNWEMIKSETGLRYLIYENVEGVNIQKDNKVILKYTVKLLTGDLIYSSDTDGLLEFVVGKGHTITGLEEGITYLSKGDKARMIIPSYLAHGLMGDQKKITFKATLVYDVEIIEVIDL